MLAAIAFGLAIVFFMTTPPASPFHWIALAAICLGAATLWRDR